jgi:putative transposase
VACRVLGVRRQGSYEWCSGVKSPRVEENELLVKHIERIHAESRGTYGWPRVHAELTLGLGLPVNHKLIARLMREAGIQGLYRRRRRGCTVRDLHAEPYVDLVDRDFVVDGPDEIWCTDVTEHPTREGKVYCAAVIDVFSRRVVGWSIGDNMRTETRDRRARHGDNPKMSRPAVNDSAFRSWQPRRIQLVVATP